MIAYHDDYAKIMEKYGLRRGVSGSEASHVSTAQYYRNIQRERKKNFGMMCKSFKIKNRKYKSSWYKRKEKIQTDKLKGAATHAATNIVESVGSLFGSNKVKVWSRKTDSYI